MKEIIRKMDDLWKMAKADPDKYLNFDDSGNYLKNDIDEVSDLSSELTWKLIDNTGNINQFAKVLLKSCGYAVYPGEQDGFGWLSGCIAKDDMILIFG